MPSYSTPSMNLSTGLSTKPTRIVPDYLAKTQKYVPLSVFFMGVPEEEAERDSLFGYRMPDRKKEGDSQPKKDKKNKSGDSSSDKDQKAKDDEDNKDSKPKDSQKGVDSSPKGQQSKPQPSVSTDNQGSAQGSQGAAGTTEALSRLVNFTQNWQSTASSDDEHKREGMTTSANVPTLPVPIGAGDGRKFLDSPSDDKKKKKKKSLSRKLYLLLRQ